MRVVKEAEERRNEILDVAEELFETKGFDNTSTGDILERIGIARGTLYYHFKSKEDILDGVIDRLASQMAEKARVIVSDKSIPILNRLTDAILSFHVESDIGQEVVEQMHKSQNALMHQKMQHQLVEVIVPIISTLIDEGIEEGIFHTEYGREALEMIILYAMIMFDDQPDQSPEQMQQRVQGFVYNIEKLFGAQQGSMNKVIMDIFAQ